MSKYTVTMVGDTHIGRAGKYDGSELTVPEADLVVGMGDWVDYGEVEEYERGVRWAKGLGCPFLLVRGNHDNGLWRRYAREVCPPSVAEQLNAHGSENNVQVVVWAPNIWRPMPGMERQFPKITAWDTHPAEIQANIIKLRDTTPGYYRFDAGGMRFVCLDASDWMLGAAQMDWLTSEVSGSELPVVLIGHHHFLPVGIKYDPAQVDERTFLRQLVLDNKKKMVAYLHGHAHMDRWWRYDDVDIIAVRNRACRRVTFEDGRVVSCELDGELDQPVPFTPDYLCARNLRPSPAISHAVDSCFDNPWGVPDTACLAWLQPEGEGVDIEWTMKLPQDISSQPHQLVFQLHTAGACQLTVAAPGLTQPTTLDVEPAPDARAVAIDIGPLNAGDFEARLTCTDGWGCVASAAEVRAV